ncbi:MGDG synthase family glycosyltransferase [Paenibacillus sp. y28]|uniref:MGDG synthase family glycosyltransferase n=1 Tax=Paenibacillus sp. y28 TaxID=3129110 RepID=UPI003FA6D7EB
MRKKRILILSEGFGAGHTRAAQALAVGMRQLSPGLQTKVMELGAFLHPTLAPLIFSAYRKTVTSQPRLYGYVYRKQYKKSLNRLSQLALHRICYAQAAAVIRQLHPDAIVCTHPFPNIVISRLKRCGLAIPLYTVITDYDAHGAWISREVNKYLVSSKEVQTKLLRRGVPADQVEVTGIPVHPSFWESHNKEELRSRFGLKPIPTVLVMGGGWGMVQPEEWFYDMTCWREQIQLVICLGSNEKLRARLAGDSRFHHPNIRLLGFSREIDKWMEVADLLITKPGGMTCTEGLAKGLPMLFYNPIPGQEEENCHYFQQLGFGDQIRSARTVHQSFERLLAEYPDRSEPDTSRRHTPMPYNPVSCSRAILHFVQG